MNANPPANPSDRAVAIAYVIRGAVEMDRSCHGRLPPGPLAGALNGFAMQWAESDPAYVLELADALEATADVLRAEVRKQGALRGVAP